MKIAILPGDGIGPEIVREARKVLDALRRNGMPIETEEAPIGGAGYDAAGHPLPASTLALAQAADAVLVGAVGVMIFAANWQLNAAQQRAVATEATLAATITAPVAASTSIISGS